MNQKHLKQIKGFYQKSRQAWSADDMAFLKRHYADCDPVWLSDVLGRTWNAIKAQAEMRGLKRDVYKLRLREFWSLVNKTDTCWVWTGRLDKGYGIFSYVSLTRSRHVHIISWMLTNGKVPPGKELDHLCRNRACVRPDHLEPVTSSENFMRGYAPAAINARKTHCMHGHPFDQKNTYIYPSGKRECRLCRRQRTQ